jgi:hypothetical protein
MYCKSKTHLFVIDLNCQLQVCKFQIEAFLLTKQFPSLCIESTQGSTTGDEMINYTGPKMKGTFAVLTF